MLRISPEGLGWRKASKTRKLIARPLSTLINDADFASKLLLETLEGTQALADSQSDTMVCVGASNDCWQQTKQKLLDKYNVVNVTKDGWLVCEPKPENEVDSVEITADILGSFKEFGVVGRWGRKQDDGSFLQYGVLGDYLCRNLKDPSDVWIVKKFIFRSTYAFVGEKVAGETVEDFLPFKKAV